MATADTTTDHIVVEQDGAILKVQMNRANKKNALTVAMYEALVAALKQLDDEDGLRVMLITGTADCFTSGNDVMDFMMNPPSSEDSPVAQFLRGIATARKPIVAAVNGLAIGIGTTMLLHCDLAYAAKSATFQMPFVNLGLCPEAASSYLLPQIMGHQRAAELLLLGQKFNADKAYEMGILNAITEDDALAATALEAAQALAAQPPASVRLSKELMKRPYAAMTEQVMKDEGAEFMQRLTSPEAAEAFTAFAERRKPDFSQFS